MEKIVSINSIIVKVTKLGTKIASILYHKYFAIIILKDLVQFIAIIIIMKRFVNTERACKILKIYTEK